MAEQNLLSGNQKLLEQVLGDIKEHTEKKERLEKLGASVKDITKELENTEKAKADEIASKVKESTDAICDGYDKSISSERDKIKKIQSERDKAKMAGIKERIDLETASLRKENEELSNQINEAFIQENIPKICNSRIFFGLFISKQALDYIIYIMFLLIVFVAVPCVLYFVPVIPNWSILLYGGLMSVIVVSLYKAVYAHTLLSHRDTILAARQTRFNINSNKDRIKKIEKGIRKDKNEEMYGLETFDFKINEAHDKISKIEAEKVAALKEFEETAKEDILSEIEGRYQGKLDNMKDELSRKKAEYSELDDLVKQQRIYISSNYEAYLGKEFVNIDKLTELNSIMKSGSADTISQAIAIYKNRR